MYFPGIRQVKINKANHDVWQTLFYISLELVGKVGVQIKAQSLDWITWGKELGNKSQKATA